jgi:NDP-sugar pyrophosphorylase family protein
MLTGEDPRPKWIDGMSAMARKSANATRTAVVLCAGIGERLWPLTRDRPKCMLDVGGIPLIGRTVNALKSQGFDRICANLYHMPDVITEYLGDGLGFGVQVHYSHESSLLGSAGGTKQFEHLLPETFVVVYGDVLTNANMGRLWQLHETAQADATLLVHRSDRPWECGVVEFDASGSVRSLVEKPARDAVTSQWVNSGVYVLNRSVLGLVKPGEPSDFGFDVFPTMLERGQSLVAAPLTDDEYVIDIGTFAGLASARERVAQ